MFILLIFLFPLFFMFSILSFIFGIIDHCSKAFAIITGGLALLFMAVLIMAFAILLPKAEADYGIVDTPIVGEISYSLYTIGMPMLIGEIAQESTYVITVTSGGNTANIIASQEKIEVVQLDGDVTSLVQHTKVYGEFAKTWLYKNDIETTNTYTLYVNK